MQISEIMCHSPRSISADERVEIAAQMMADSDLGFLPVVQQDAQLVGVITDRDIVIRAVARGNVGLARVREVMTSLVEHCEKHDDVAVAIKHMSDLQIRRMPVVATDGSLVGVITLADIARHDHLNAGSDTLKHVVRPGGQHNQPAYHRTTFGN